jgi:hypothetical protein
VKIIYKGFEYIKIENNLPGVFVNMVDLCNKWKISWQPFTKKELWCLYGFNYIAKHSILPLMFIKFPNSVEVNGEYAPIIAGLLIANYEDMRGNFKYHDELKLYEEICCRELGREKFIKDVREILEAACKEGLECELMLANFLMEYG